MTAALGGEQLHAGLIAGAIGLGLVVIYLVVYYRGLSIIAIPSLLVSGALTYVIMALLGPTIGFALNLPAVCGAIVAIGITADSFIVFFERIRDEIREGRSLRRPSSMPGRAPGAPSWSPTSCRSSPPRCSSSSPSARSRASRSRSV